MESPSPWLTNRGYHSGENGHGMLTPSRDPSVGANVQSHRNGLYGPDCLGAMLVSYSARGSRPRKFGGGKPESTMCAEMRLFGCAFFAAASRTLNMASTSATLAAHASPADIEQIQNGQGMWAEVVDPSVGEAVARHEQRQQRPIPAQMGQTAVGDRRCRRSPSIRSAAGRQ